MTREATAGLLGGPRRFDNKLNWAEIEMGPLDFTLRCEYWLIPEHSMTKEATTLTLARGCGKLSWANAEIWPVSYIRGRDIPLAIWNHVQV